ncbi:MAG: branched-chain amino acid transport system ATP-binding protein [Chloroflexota bacterium]|jgi:branched-chain amino acid transport system ATP-binding protein|nr:branched-chain amino acid transport system ATP-binding protein [Chloroflexota bacterium]
MPKPTAGADRVDTTLPLLSARALCSGFEAGPVLFGIDLDVSEGEMVAVIGSNGAGKSTLLGTLSGLVLTTSGSTMMAGKDLTRETPQRRLAAGLAHVPQGRRLFGDLTVSRNLLLGAYLRRDADVKGDLDRVIDYFPTLKNKLRRDAGTLSGGEQQMVAIGRGLMSRPRVLMVDELSLGLAPKVAEDLLQILRGISHEGTAMLLVEQDVVLALEVSDRGYVLENGRVALSGAADTLANDPQVRQAYLGI